MLPGHAATPATLHRYSSRPPPPGHLQACNRSEEPNYLLHRFGRGDAVSEWEVQSLSASIVYVDSEAFFKASGWLLRRFGPQTFPARRRPWYGPCPPPGPAAPPSWPCGLRCSSRPWLVSGSAEPLDAALQPRRPAGFDHHLGGAPARLPAGSHQRAGARALNACRQGPPA